MTAKDQSRNSDLRGIKSSNSVMDLYSPYSDITEDLMRTSFWLPTDAIRHPGWKVDSVVVTTGEQFHLLMISSSAGWFANIHCDVSEDLVAAAHYVGLSIRQRKSNGAKFLVAKVWYGIPKRVDDLKLEDV